MDDVERFAEFLKREGMKLTPQRETILRRALSVRKKHFSAEQLYELLREDGHKIGKATVYRTLTALVDAGIVTEHDFELGHKLYERAHQECHHDHLICVGEGCSNRFREFHNEVIERLQEEIAQQYGFSIVSHTHQIFGLCRECRERVEPGSGGGGKA